MDVLRWCCRCQRVVKLPNEGGAEELICPSCGAPGGNLQTWSSVRDWNPHWPSRPVVGKAYRIRRDCTC